jgi:hypothetical protein
MLRKMWALKRKIPNTKVAGTRKYQLLIKLAKAIGIAEL